MSWFTPDGLLIKYGTELTTPQTTGEYCVYGPLRCVEIKLDLTTLTDTAAIICDTFNFPKGARIEQVDVVTETAATSGGSATLTIGLVKTDRTTAIDADGFVSALAKTSLTPAGEKILLTVGATSAGSSIGATTTDVGFITANYGTAAFTAGAVVIRIYYMVP